MAASRKKKRTALRAVIVLVLCLVLICVAGAAVAWGLVSSRLKAFRTGTTFAFDYQVSATEEAPALYRILDSFGAVQGHLSGQSGADSLQFSLYTQDDRTTPVTRVYISPDETLYDVGQIYANVRTAVVDEYPLASLLIPEWTLGDHISQTQLAAVLGVDSTDTSLQQMTGFQLEWKNLKRIQPENGLEGYLYFQLTSENASANDPVLTLGLAKENLLQTTSPMTHILISFPEQAITIELKGAITAAQTVMTPPTSRMKDEDVLALVQLRETIQSIVSFVQQAA